MGRWSGIALNFSSAFNFYKIRNNGNWVTSLPAISIQCKKSADNKNGIYKIDYPNPQGFALNIFTHFEEQEIWLADPSDSTMYRAFVGQINDIDFTASKNILQINGRGLSGYFSDRKVNNSWSEKRIDYIVADPTYGFFPNEFSSTLSTWKAFTDDYDMFESWNSTYWGTKPSYCTVWEDSGELEFQGAAGSDRQVTGTTEYNYEVCEFRLKVDSASDTVRFGFTNTGNTNYVRFELEAAGVNVETNDGSETSEALSSPPTQTDYNYYRIEWDNSEARFFVNGVNVKEITTNVPTANLKLFMQVDTSDSLLTVDYMKAIVLTREMDKYLVKNKIMSDVLKELCDIGTETESFTFFVDDDHILNAQISQSVESGYGFGFKSLIYNASTEKIKEISLTEEAKDLYNRVKIEGGTSLTEVSAPDWTEQYIGDGVQTTFVFGYKIEKPVTLLEVNSVEKTENTHFDVTYGTQHTIFKFTSGNTPADTHTVNVRANYYEPIVATANNKTSQETYGVIREYVKQDDTIQEQTRAQRLADALLSFYSDPRAVIKITIPLKPQLEIGQTIMVDAPYVGITNSKYEIIELEHKFKIGIRQTTLTLASAEIDSNAEIIREILQQLKDLRTKGETTETILEEYPVEETADFTENLYLETRWECDSFILGHAQNGKLGYGQILDNFESSVVANWTGTDFTESESTDQSRVGSKSMKLEYSGTGVKTTSSTQSFGDLSTETGVVSGTPSKGGLGCWVYLVTASDISAFTIDLGSGGSDYATLTMTLYGSTTGNVQRIGWNYFVGKMEEGAITGTPDWTAVDYCNLNLTVASGTYIYVDYLTISQSDAADPNRIGLNGLGSRYMTTGDVEVTLTG